MGRGSHKKHKTQPQPKQSPANNSDKERKDRNEAVPRVGVQNGMLVGDRVAGTAETLTVATDAAARPRAEGGPSVGVQNGMLVGDRVAGTAETLTVATDDDLAEELEENKDVAQARFVPEPDEEDWVLVEGGDEATAVEEVVGEATAQPAARADNNTHQVQLDQMVIGESFVCLGVGVGDSSVS